MTDSRIFVSSESVASSAPYDIVWSNISFLNALQGEYLRTDELSPDALLSYYVDYYLAQMNNGGFAQFVYNSNWHPILIQYVRDGLEAMGATEHRALFEESAAILDKLGPEGVDQFLDGEFFGENQERDTLNAFNDRFYALNKQDDLIAINSRWLRAHPELMVLDASALEQEVARRAAAVPDRDARIAEALASEPRYFQLIRALCQESGQTLEMVTAGDGETYKGCTYLAWHFITDQGHHYMIDTDTEALMFNDTSKTPIATFAIPADFSDD